MGNLTFFGIIIMLASLIVYVFVLCVFLPKSMLKNKLLVTSAAGRGFLRFKDKCDNESLVFETEKKYREFVPQYILSERDLKKRLVLKLKDTIKYVDYDIVVFGLKDKVIDVINVCEYVKTQGVSSQVELPTEAMKVAIILNKVNNTTFNDKVFAPITKGKIIKYIITSMLLTIFENLFLRLILIGRVPNASKLSFMFFGVDFAYQIIIFLLFFSIYTLVTILVAIKRNKPFRSVK